MNDPYITIRIITIDFAGISNVIRMFRFRLHTMHASNIMNFIHACSALLSNTRLQIDSILFYVTFDLDRMLCELTLYEIYRCSKVSCFCQWLFLSLSFSNISVYTFKGDTWTNTLLFFVFFVRQQITIFCRWAAIFFLFKLIIIPHAQIAPSDVWNSSFFSSSVFRRLWWFLIKTFVLVDYRGHSLKHQELNVWHSTHISSRLSKYVVMCKMCWALLRESECQAVKVLWQNKTKSEKERERETNPSQARLFLFSLKVKPWWTVFIKPWPIFLPFFLLVHLTKML